MSRRTRLHRKTGFTVAAFLVLFVCSGILLHHTDSLNLDSNYVSSAVILDFYGFDQAPSAQSITAFASNENSILVQIDEHVYLDDQAIFNFQGDAEKMVAATDTHKYITFATQQHVYVFDKTGTLFDVLETPFVVQDMGFIDGQLIVKGDRGYSVLEANMLDWRAMSAVSDPPPQPWSKQLLLQNDQVNAIWNLHRNSLLSWSRVIQDVHSGRIGGWIGNLVADLAALALLVLAISGLSMGRRGKEGNNSQSRKLK